MLITDMNALLHQFGGTVHVDGSQGPSHWCPTPDCQRPYGHDIVSRIGLMGSSMPRDIEPPQETEDPTDWVNHPPHYTAHPSGVECITVTEHMNFCLGNAVKYIWRAGEKGDRLEDLKKSRWYLDREINRLEKEHYSE